MLNLDIGGLLGATFGVVLSAGVFGFIWLRGRRQKAIVEHGSPAIAEVLDCHQTHMSVNQTQVMSLTLRIPEAGGSTRDVTITQAIDFGNMPRMGDKVVAMVDKRNPANVVYGGLATGELANADPQWLADNQALIADINGLPTGFQNTIPRTDQYKPGVATILSEQPALGGKIRFTLEVDSVVKPKRTITVEQRLSDKFDVGERVYLLVDEFNPDLVAITPLSLLKGNRIPKKMNRLDALVLGPQLLHEGKKATGTVLEATRIPLPAPLPGFPDARRYLVRFHVEPEDTAAPPYEAEQSLSFLSADRAERIAKVGAKVPLRFDWNDPRTICPDAIAMGYPDPYKEVNNAYKANTAAWDRQNEALRNDPALFGSR